MRVRLACSIAIALVVATAFAACGEDEPRVTGPIADKVREVQAAFDDGDVAAACSNMTRRAQMMIAFSGHNRTLTACQWNLRKLRRNMRKEGADGRTPEVVATKPAPGGAVVTLRLPDAAPVDVPLAKVGGEWKLDGVFSARASSFQRTNGVPRAVESAAVVAQPVAVSSPPATPIAVRDGRRRGSEPCPVLSEGRDGVKGGCELQLQGEGLEFDVLNAFGAMPFERCGAFLGFRVDRSGRALVTQWGGQGLGGCGDVKMCKRDGRDVPWPARLIRDRDGGLRLHVEEMCLDTCVGLYRGDWTLDLRRQAGLWRATARQDAVGHSGFRFDGTVIQLFGGRGMAVEPAQTATSQ